MTRISAFCLALLLAGMAFLPDAAALAAPAPAAAAAAPALAAPAPVDLFTVSGIRVDATAESATIARDQASGVWGRQPQLQDNQLLRLIRSFEVANERRSTTRYLADVTFHFNPAAVRQFLRQAGIPFTEARSRPALVIPIVVGAQSYDPMSAWAMSWSDPALQQGLVPSVLPMADAQDVEILSKPDLAQSDWASLAPMARRYNATAVVLAIASEDAKSVQVVELSAQARTTASLAYAQSTFLADAEAVMDRVNETWKTRASVDYGNRGRIVADVSFDTLEDWAKIRAQLGATRAVSDYDVIGLALHEAEISVSYFGRPEQLRDTLAQQNLQLTNNGGQYQLQLGGATAANAQ
jgi:hypothetical protein